ncbi:BON domain-containing protein [Asanoa sp. NPDC049573]|uniref:BON domain-containing protein n=1 Tax=Asanoa sp. NPDC049573 TaxID=3155396 RepID=UPI0034257408
MTQAVQRTDKDLQTLISDELLFTPDLDAARIEVSVKEGVVNLAGDVGTLPERHAAKRAAMRLWGVKSVIDGIVVRIPRSSGTEDGEIAKKATQLLDWAVDVPSATVKADVDNHVITLSGTVAWAYQRDAAERAVTYLNGLAGIRNDISLSQGGGVTVMKPAVEKAIARNAQLRTQAITIDLKDHELTLHGTVRSFADRRGAEHAAWSAAGVTSVRNDLRVTP